MSDLPVEPNPFLSSSPEGEPSFVRGLGAGRPSPLADIQEKLSAAARELPDQIRRELEALHRRLEDARREYERRVGEFRERFVGGVPSETEFRARLVILEMEYAGRVRIAEEGVGLLLSNLERHLDVVRSRVARLVQDARESANVAVSGPPPEGPREDPAALAAASSRLAQERGEREGLLARATQERQALEAKIRELDGALAVARAASTVSGGLTAAAQEQRALTDKERAKREVAEAELARARAEADSALERIGRLSARVAELEASALRLAEAEGRGRELSAKIERMEELAVEQRQQAVKDARAQAESLERRLAGVEAERDEALAAIRREYERGLGEGDAERRQLEKRLRDAEEGLRQSKNPEDTEAILRLKERLDHEQVLRLQMGSERQTLDAEVKKLVSELAVLRPLAETAEARLKELDSLRVELETARVALSNVQAQAQAQAQAAQGAQGAELAAARKDLETARAEAAARQKEFDALRAEIEATRASWAADQAQLQGYAQAYAQAYSQLQAQAQGQPAAPPSQELEAARAEVARLQAALEGAKAAPAASGTPEVRLAEAEERVKRLVSGLESEQALRMNLAAEKERLSQEVLRIGVVVSNQIQSMQKEIDILRGQLADAERRAAAPAPPAPPAPPAAPVPADMPVDARVAKAEGERDAAREELRKLKLQVVTQDAKIHEIYGRLRVAESERDKLAEATKGPHGGDWMREREDLLEQITIMQRDAANMRKAYEDSQRNWEETLARQDGQRLGEIAKLKAELEKLGRKS